MNENDVLIQKVTQFMFWSMCTPRDFVDDTCFTGWSFILKEGISGNVDNFCLDATNTNSVFVKFKVSLLADSHVYTLFTHS